MIKALAPTFAGLLPRFLGRTGPASCALVALALVFGPAANGEVAELADTTDIREWNFRVLLDEKEIGFHRFRLEQDGPSRVLESNARFDVRFLFITAYKYRHLNRETWNDACLVRLEADTEANGRSTVISGRQVGGRFVVDDGAEVAELPECVMSFAYWDPRILSQARLLNAQTGELVEVDVEAAANEVLDIRGAKTPAKRYRLVGDELQIDVWYSLDDEWLALESPAKGGRKLRYVLT